jgi:hypothetical protein
VDLHPRQIGVDPRLDLVMTGGQQPPTLAMTITTVRPHRLHHQPNEHVGQLLDVAVTSQPQRFGGGDVAAHRLAIDL